MRKLIKSPTTGVAMNQILNRYSYCRSSQKGGKDKRLQQIVLKIRKHKTKKDTNSLKACVEQLKKIASVRETAKKLGMHYSGLHRLLTVRDRSACLRHVTEKHKETVRNFYSSSSISLQLPYKKYAKFYYLRTPLAVAYEEYAKEQRKLNCRVLSRSTVYRCLKGQFRIRKKIPFKDCQCDTCLNNSLLVDALIVGGIKHLHRRVTQNITLSYCPIEAKENNEENVITDYKRDCIYRDCQRCGVINFQEALCKANPDVDWSKTVVWHQWEKVENPKAKKKKSFDKIRYQGAMSTLLTNYIQSLDRISVHMFDFRWQAFQLDECKKLLQNGDCLFIVDFAQNHSHHRQDEILGAYWSRKQSTLHPFVIYYLCPERCNNLVKEEVMIISDDLKHDAEAVNKFTDKVIEHLKQRNVPVERVILFSDNCSSQYKCVKYFKALTQRNVPFLHNHFGAKHGKAEADGAIGRLSQHIDAVTRSGTHEFGDCKQLAEYCHRILRTPDVKSGMCCHYRKYFYEVPKFERADDDDLLPVTGSSSFHAVRNTGIPGVIEVRESSCFCEPCFLGTEGDCKNKHLVKNYRWAKVSENEAVQRDYILNNDLWNSHHASLKFIHRVRKRTYIGRKRPKVQTAKLKIAQKTVKKAKRFSLTDTAKSRQNASVSGVKYKKAHVSDGTSTSDIQGAATAVNTSEQDSSRVSRNGKKRTTIASLNRDDSDYEDGVPLARIKTIQSEQSEWSPVSSRTRLNLNNRTFVRCEKVTDQVDLDDYEGTITKKVRIRLKRVDECDDWNNFGLSGIGPLLFDSCEQSSFVSSTPFKKSQSNQSKLTEIEALSPIARCETKRSSSSDTGKKRHVFTWGSFHKEIKSCKTYTGLETVIDANKNRMPPLPSVLYGDRPSADDVIDTESEKHYVPADKPANFVNHRPVQTEPDGNCFFRALSRLAYGTESKHLEMRCRVVVDSVQNIDNYTDHDYLMRGAKHDHKKCFHIGMYYCMYSGVTELGNRDQSKNGIREVFKENVMRIRHEFQYNDIWHLHSAANVLCSKIVMLFPTKYIRENVRVDLNRCFLPSNSNFIRNEFSLLWTVVCPKKTETTETETTETETTETEKDKKKKYDHIVPLICVQKEVKEPFLGEIENE